MWHSGKQRTELPVILMPPEGFYKHTLKFRFCFWVPLAEGSGEGMALTHVLAGTEVPSCASSDLCSWWRPSVSGLCHPRFPPALSPCPGHLGLFVPTRLMLKHSLSHNSLSSGLGIGSMIQPRFPPIPSVAGPTPVVTCPAERDRPPVPDSTGLGETCHGTLSQVEEMQLWAPKREGTEPAWPYTKCLTSTSDQPLGASSPPLPIFTPWPTAFWKIKAQQLNSDISRWNFPMCAVQARWSQLFLLPLKSVF